MNPFSANSLTLSGVDSLTLGQLDALTLAGADDSFVTHTVEIKDSLDDASWSSSPYLFCLNLTTGLAPTLDQATLFHNFGTMWESGDAAYAYRARLDLRGKFVRIAFGDAEWLGCVVREQLRRGVEEDNGGTQRLEAGDQLFTAVGLEWFLMRELVHSSVIYHATSPPRINRAMPFNGGFGDDRDLSYAELGNKSSVGEFFTAGPDSTAVWKADEAVRYLLTNHGPVDKNENYEPTFYELSPAGATYLDWELPPTRTEGLSLWQLLNEIISPRRGLTWWLTSKGDGSNTFVVNVSSYATASITLPSGATLPAASSIVALGDSVLEHKDRPVVEHRLDRKWPKVICRGARRRAVFTLSVDDGTLEAGWQSAEETQYIDGVSNDPITGVDHSSYAGYSDEKKRRVNDRFRQSDRFRHVYQDFRIPGAWDGKTADGDSVSTKLFCCPIVVESTGSIVGNETLVIPGFRLLNTLPIKAGYDYTTPSNPTSRDPTDTAPEWMRPFAVFQVDGTNWRHAHQINTIAEADGQPRLTNYTLSMLAGAAGVRLTPSGGLPHALADNHFDSGSPEPSRQEVELSYDNLRVTVAGEFDAYCEAQWPEADPDDDPLQTLYIQIGERARFDYINNGTIFDVQDGGLQKVNESDARNRVLRDDRQLCKDIARIAYEWYGQDRATLEWNVARIDTTATLGELITTIGTAEAAETVNAVVSQISWDLFSQGRTSYLAGFAELDFETLA